MRRAGAVLVGAVVCGVVAAPALAFNFFELEVYPATTEGKGLHEVENIPSFVANGRRPDEEEAAGETPRRPRLLRTSLEYDYGLSDKIDIAAYLDLDRPNGEDLEYAQSRFRARGAFFDKGRFPLDVGWYLEAEVPDRGKSELELEFRPIVSRGVGRFAVDLNPMFELPTVTAARATDVVAARGDGPGALTDSARGQREQPSCVRRGRPGNHRERLAAHRRHHLRDEADVRWLVPAPPVRDRREVRRIGLDEQAIEWHGAHRVAQHVGVLE